MTHRIVLSLAVLAALATLAVAPAHAQAQTLKIAIVDMDSISDQYKELTDRQTELQAWVKERKAFLNALQDFMFISSEEFQEIGRIYQAPAAQWTEAQKTREAALRKIAEDNEKRFLDMQAKPARTAEEQNQYNTLRDTFQARDRDLKGITRAFDDQLRARRDEVQDKLATNVRQVIEKLAKAQGYALVLDKAMTYYVGEGIVDLTAEVLKSLNASATAAGGGNAGGTPTP